MLANSNGSRTALETVSWKVYDVTFMPRSLTYGLGGKRLLQAEIHSRHSLCPCSLPCVTSWGSIVFLEFIFYVFGSVSQVKLNSWRVDTVAETCLVPQISHHRVEP